MTLDFKQRLKYLLYYTLYARAQKRVKQECGAENIFSILKFDGFLNFTTSFYQEDFHLNFLTEKITIFKSDPVFG